MVELTAFKKARAGLSYLVSIHFGSKVILWEFSSTNPLNSKLSEFEMDSVNESFAGNALLSTESGGISTNQFDVPIQLKQLWADNVIMRDKKREF